MKVKINRILVSTVVGLGLFLLIFNFLSIKESLAASPVAPLQTAEQIIHQEMPKEESTVPQPIVSLEEAYQRVLAVGVYKFSAQSQQTLIPRPIPSMIGQSEQRVDMQVEGEVTLPDYSMMSVSMDGLGLDPTPVTMVMENGESYVLQQGEKILTENMTGLVSPSGDYLSYLAAAENVQPCAAANAPFETAVYCYTYDIDGHAFAEHVRAQTQAQLEKTPGASSLGLHAGASPVLQRMSGQGKVWLDANGLPLRQKIDMVMPEMDTYYDADIIMVIDYQFDAETVAATKFETSILPSPEVIVAAIETSLPNFAVFFVFVALVAMLLILYRRRWLYSFVAISIVGIMLLTPILQIIGANLYFAHQAFAAEPIKPLFETLAANNTTDAGTSALAPETASALATYQPDTYCGKGGNSDRDGDGLADDAEYCLGTNPNEADTDFDGINDGKEVAGFTFNGKSWYSDPLNPDSNLDGLNDDAEWITTEGGTAASWDLDEDTIPNVWDTDDDGDGVTDGFDLSPHSFTNYFLSTDYSPSPITDTFSFNISGSYDGYIYVDMQVQPEDLNHLRYGASALDWDYDTQGLIQDRDSSTDDIRLFPLLSVETNVVPGDALAKEYNIVTMKDMDSTGYQELLIPLTPVGDGGSSQAFSLHMAYGPETLANLNEAGIHWQNAQIVWMVQAKIDSENGNGVTSKNQPVHLYTERSMRLTGWTVTKSGRFNSAVLGTPDMPGDDRQLFQLLFGLSASYLNNSNLTLTEIDARFSGANTPIAQKWGITTTVEMDTPSMYYAHFEEGVKDFNERIKSFLADYYPMDQTSVVILASESNIGLVNQDNMEQFNPPLNKLGANLNQIFLVKQRSLELHMRDGWDIVGGTDYDKTVFTRINDSLTTAKQSLQDQYPNITKEQLSAVTLAYYVTWQNGRNSILNIDGISGDTIPPTDQALYERYYLTPLAKYNDPGNISTLPGYLVEVGNLGQKGSGLIMAGGPAQTHQYMQSNLQEARDMGFTASLASFINNVDQAIVSVLGQYQGEELSTYEQVNKLAATVSDSNWYTHSKAIASNAIGTADTVYDTVKGMKDAVKEGATRLSSLKQTTTSISKISKVGAVMLAIDIGIQIGMFFAAGDFSPSAIAALLAGILLSILLFIIALNPIGAIIIGIVAIVDLILLLVGLGKYQISGFAAQFLALSFYSSTALTILDMESLKFTNRQTNLLNKEMGYIAGNRFQVTDQFKAVVELARSSWKDNFAFDRLKQEVAHWGGLGTKYLAQSWACAEFDVKGWSSLNYVTPRCPSPYMGYDPDSPATKESIGFQNYMEAEILLDTPGANLPLAINTKVTARTYNLNGGIINIFTSGNIMSFDPFTLTLPNDMEEEDKQNWQPQIIYLDVLPPTVEELWAWSNEAHGRILTNYDPDGDAMTTPNEIKAWLGSTAYAIMKDELGPFAYSLNLHNVDQLLSAWETPINGITIEAMLAAENMCPTGTNWPNLCDANTTIFWLDSDSDDDGLSDKFEYDNQSALGTNFAKYDSDEDGLSDGFEYQIGTAINAQDTDGDGLTDDQEVYHPTATGTWEGGYVIQLPQYGAVGPNGRILMDVRVFSDPRSKDTDGDGLSDAAEKENGTSPTAYNRVPRVTLTGQPWAVSPTGQGAIYVGTNDRITLTSRIEVYPPFTVSDTLSLNVPSSVMGANTTPSLNGSRTVPNTGYFQQPQWNFSNNVLQPWEYLYASTPGWSQYVNSSRTATATLILPYNNGSATQTAELPIVLDAEQPVFSLLTPAHGELIGGGVTHYVMGGSSSDPTTWVDHINLDLPYLGTQTISDSRHLSPWAYTWELPADGIYNVGGYAVDFVDNVSANDAARIMIDNTAPSVDVDLQDGAVFGPPQDSSVITITLNGSASENYSGLTRVQISTDNGPWREVWTKENATQDNTTYTDFSTPFYERATGATWTAEWTLPNVETVQGYHSLRVRAFDEAGNWPTPIERTIIIDVLPPTDELVNRAYVSEFPHVPANEPHTFRGVANDVGNVPQPSRPVELVGTLDSINDATIWLGLSNIDENNGGINVAWIGDFNGDRRGDLLVGLPAADEGAGRVAVVYGRSGNWPVPDSAEMLADASTSFIGLPGAGIGLQATAAGDVNGDGLADLLIGDATNNAVYLVLGNNNYYGSDLQLDDSIGVNIRRLQVPAGQQIGHNIAAAGDVNGDGYDDILIGVTGSRNAAYLLLGQPAPIWQTDDISQHAAALIYTAGTATLGTAGDLNGDFRDEFVVGLNNTLYLFAGGGTFTPRAGLTLYPTSNNVDTFSSADGNPTIAALGDVDGDNKDDAIYSNGTSQVLLFGDDTLSDRNWATHTYSYGAGFLAAPGDVDGDGRSDILIGNGTDAYLILGSDIGTAQATINSVAAAASVRYAAGADLNSDGSSDLLLVPTAANAQAAATTADSTFDLPPTWVPNLPEATLDTFVGSTTWPSEGATAYVNSDGICHSLTPCYTTIQAAVDNHNNSATILVQPGVYAPFIIDGDVRGYNYLTVRGMNTDAVIIDGNGSSYAIRVNNAVGVNLENMTVRNASYGVQLDRAGINGHETAGYRTELRTMLIYGTGSHDVYMSRDSTASIINSTLSRSSNHIGAYGAADPNIVVEWSSMAASDWPILPGGGAVTLGDYIYTLRGGGNNTFGRYDIAANTWPDPWGPHNAYEDNSAIALGNDDQVYVLGAPHWRDTSLNTGYDANYTAGGNGVMYAVSNYLAYVWSGNEWIQIPGSPQFVYLMAAHPVTGDLYVYDYILHEVLKWDGNSWTTEIETGFYFAEARDMAIGSDGTIYFSGSFSNVFRGEYNPTCSGQVIYAHPDWTTFSCQDYGEDAVVHTIAAHPTNSAVYVGGSFEASWGAQNITTIGGGYIEGVSGSVYSIDVDDEGVVYLGGEFTSTLRNGSIDQLTPAGIASWSDGVWTGYPTVIESDGWLQQQATHIAATGGGEFYANGRWHDLTNGTYASFIHWDGSSWELGLIGNENGTAYNGNATVWSMESAGQGMFISGHLTSIEIGGESVSTTTDRRNFLLQSPFEVYSTTQNSWYSGIAGPPIQLGDGASMAGDEFGNLVVLAGGDRNDSFKYDIETGQWSRVTGMNVPVNASAMVKGENGYVYAIVDSGAFYRFSGYSWTEEAPVFSGATLADGITLAYDTHFGTYYLLPGGNSTKMFRYNPDWGSSWVALPAERETPSGVRPGAGLVFVEGEDENWLFTAQGNYDGGLSTSFWRYPLPMPNKIDFTNSIIYAQNGTNWLNLSDPLPEDFNFRVDANSRFFGGSGWTPTNMGTLPTTTAVPFLDAARDVYRMSETGATYTIGYHIYTEPVTATTATGIQAMINTGANQVIVQPGIYEEDVYLVNGVELIGTNPDWTVIRPLNGSTANTLVRAMGSNGASFSRFTLDGSDSGLDGFAATGNAANLTVQRVRIFDTDTAISIDGPDSDVEVAHITAANNTNGLVASNCASIDVRNSIFAYGTGVGLSHEACADVQLHTYNLFWANASDFGGSADAGAAELFLDPSFVDPMDHDYRTLNFSPVIDAGNPTDPSPPGAGSRADIGYIEQGRVNFYVDDSYCAICTNDGLTWRVDAFDNLQDALNAAEYALSNLNPGVADVPQLVVGVAPGTYHEQVTIPSHVLLFGSGAEETIIDAGGSGTAVSFVSVTDAGIRNFTITNADTGIFVDGSSNFIDIRRNLFTNNLTGLSVNGRASISAEYNTLANNNTGMLASDPGSWILAMHNIVATSVTGVQATNSGQIFSNYNLYFNTSNLDGVIAGDSDMIDQNPQFAGGGTPYRLSQTSPAVDAASVNAPVPNGGGTLADLGYSELLAAPVTLLLGQEDLSTVMGNSGVASVEYGVVPAPDVNSAITETLPTSWYSITLDSPGETFSYWALDHTPTEEGFYRFYSRAADMVGNQETDELDWYDGSFVVDSTPPIVEWLSPANGASLEAPLELRAQVSDYAAGQFSVDENDVYFKIDGQRYPATWAAEPWDEAAGEPRIFRAWISPTLGTYSNVIAGAEDKAGNEATDNSLSFTLTAVSAPDNTPPTVTLTLPAPNSWVTHTVTFSGTASDLGSGIASVEISLDGGATWRPSTVSGEVWSLTWNGPEGLPLVSYPAQVRATDRAGQTAVLPFQFTIDEIAPTGLVPVTFSHPEGSHFDAVTDLAIDWVPPIDVSSVITTFLVVDQITDTIPMDVVNGLSATYSLDSSGDWYAHLAAMDAAGNIQLLHYGPWHVGLNEGLAFGSQQQSIIIDGYVDVDNNEWRLDSEYLDDDERTYGSEVTYSPNGQQSFLTAWDANSYYMAWRGGQWTLDGELWIYLKAGGNGSNELIVPLASAPTAILPFAADYAIQITDPLTGTLYEYSGGWQVSAEGWAFAQGGSGDTEIRLPLFGTSNVELLAFGLGDDANIWAIFPATNPLNPGTAPAARPAGLDGIAAESNGWQSYQWDDVTIVNNVAANQPLAVALEVDLASTQAPTTPWGPNGTLKYIITINNLEDDVISGQPISLMATPGAALVHDSVEGATCSTTNPWECTLDPLAPGRNVITLTTHLANDLSGLASVTMVATLTDGNIPPEMQTQDSISHHIDGTPPVVDVATPRFVGLGSYTFKGSASDGQGIGVDYVEVRPQFGSWQRAEGTTLWTVDLTVSPFAQHGDSWQFEVRAVDFHGQVSAPETVTFTVDLEGPNVTFDSPTELSGSMNEIMGSINDLPEGSEAATVLVQLDNEQWREATLFALNTDSGSQPFLWTWNMPTEDGVTHTLRVQTSDLVGNSGTLSPEQAVWVDNVAPIITVTGVLTEVAAQHYYPGAPVGGPVLAGSVTDGTAVNSVSVWLELPNGANRVDTAVLNTDTGTWEYVPELQTLGIYKLQVRTQDSLGNQNQTAFYTLEVKAAPESGPNSFFTPEDTPLTFEPLLDDIDIDSDTIYLDAVANPAHGTATIASDTQIIYTPTLNFNGSDVFTYTATDGQFFDTATVTVTVLPVNDPPQISGSATITDTMDEDGGSLTFNLNGMNVDDDTFSWQVIGGTGTAEVSNTSGTGNLNAEITYTPPADFNGQDSFQVQVSDGVYNDSVTISVTVNPIDDAPRAADDYLVLVPADASLPHLMDVLANDDEVDGQSLQLDAVGTPSGGGTAVAIVNQLHYTTNLSEGESETVSYTVSDGVLTDTATLHVSMVEGVASGQPGETVTVSGLGQNNTVDLTLNIPTNVVSGDEQITFVLRQINMKGEPPQGFKFAGLAFALEVYVDGTLISSPFELDNPITITIEYSDEDVADIGKGDDELMLYFWDGSEWLTDGITLVEHDKANNQIVLEIGHLTEFALFGKDMTAVYLPMIVKP